VKGETGNVSTVVLKRNGAEVGRFDNPSQVKEGTHTFPVSLAAFPEGSATLQAFAFQGDSHAGLVGASNIVHLVVDRAAPAIANLLPPNGSSLSTLRPAMSANFSDNLSGVDPASAQIVLDGNDITAQAAVTAEGFTFTPSSDLAESSHLLAVVVRDRAGNVSELAMTSFTLDVTPPPPPALTTPGPITTTEETVVIEGTISTDVVDVNVTVDTSAVVQSVTFGSTLRIVISRLPFGETNVTIVLTDRAGNKSDPFVVTLFREAPTPNAVRNLKGLPGDGKAVLAWVPPQGTQAVTGYRVFHVLNGDETPLGETVKVAFLVTDLVNGVPLKFRVKAFNAFGEGPGSDVEVTPFVLEVTVLTQGKRVTCKGIEQLNGSPFLVETEEPFILTGTVNDPDVVITIEERVRNGEIVVPPGFPDAVHPAALTGERIDGKFVFESNFSSGRSWVSFPLMGRQTCIMTLWRV
jgi:hypothetical protein